MNSGRKEQSYLRRLPAENYRGAAYVHWSLTIENRQQGWLKPIFYYKFRELLTHALFRHGLCCPIFCCMPDHMHLLWIGILDSSDQLAAMRFFRTQLNWVLEKLDVTLQKQAYDHVLSEAQRERDAFEAAAEYIARNPERAHLVKADCYREYGYTGCLIPGYPELSPWRSDYWPRFWNIYSNLQKNGLIRMNSDKQP
jgi:putative transposase